MSTIATPTPAKASLYKTLPCIHYDTERQISGISVHRTDVMRGNGGNMRSTGCSSRAICL
jgi:hypothetical protein